MGNTGMIVTRLGQELDDITKRKIEKAVITAIEDHAVTDFYFSNVDDDIIEENEYAELYIKSRNSIDRFAIEKIREYAKAHPEKSLHTTILVARLVDDNYDKTLYDEVIQGYSLYYNEVESIDSFEAFALRDNFLTTHIDKTFWCSNKILVPNILKNIDQDKFIIIE